MSDGTLSDQGETQASHAAAATTDLQGARQLAATSGGTLYLDERPDWQHLPFRGLLVVGIEDAEAIRSIGDVGTYRLEQRVIKPGQAQVFGLFPMVRAPSLTHEQADAHWRDVHGPLALEHHGFMTHYLQLSVVEVLSGLPLDGFALCGFTSEADLRERFYSTEDGPAAIAADVARFSDLKRSPRRLIAVPERFAKP